MSLVSLNHSQFVSIRTLTHFYPQRKHETAPRRALDNLSMAVEEGVFFVLTGPNGGGKSTLFRILCGLMNPSSGEVRIGGHDPQQDPAQVRALMGVVFQSPALDRHLTIAENLRIHAALYGLKAPMFHSRLADALAWTGLESRLDDRINTLSGGMARQVELVKALLHRPRILLLDEPTTGLDPGSRRAFTRTLRTIQKEHRITILMTSHNFFEAEESDQVAIIHNGRLLAQDSPDHLKSQLGREMLVIRSSAMDRIQNELVGHHPELAMQRTENHLTVHSHDPAGLLRHLFDTYREDIQDIGIKQPTLEDVYIHITGQTLQDHEISTDQL